MGRIADCHDACSQLELDKIALKNQVEFLKKVTSNAHNDLEKQVFDEVSHSFVVSLRAQVQGSIEPPLEIDHNLGPLRIGPFLVDIETRLAWFAQKLKAISSSDYEDFLVLLGNEATLNQYLERHRDLLANADLAFKEVSATKLQIYMQARSNEIALEKFVSESTARMTLEQVKLGREIQAEHKRLELLIENFYESKIIHIPAEELGALYGLHGYKDRFGEFLDFLSESQDRWLALMTYLTFSHYSEQRKTNCKSCALNPLGLRGLQHVTEKHFNWNWNRTRNLLDKHEIQVRKQLKIGDGDFWLHLGTKHFEPDSLLEQLLKYEFEIFA